MDIKHLKYFVEVARHKSFSKAANINFVSQSTISKMVKDLELELGVGLLNRTSKYVELTDEGERLFLQAQKMIEMFDNINNEFQNSLSLEQGKISIGLPPITGATEFAQLLGQFSKNYPKIDINLFEYGSKKVEIGIQDGTLDVGIVCAPPSNENYDKIPFSKDPLKVIMNIEHRLSKESEIGFKELRNESFVLYRHDFSLYDQILSRCKLAGFSPHVIFETSQRELMTQIVDANLGIALLPSKICDEVTSPNIIAVSLDEPIFLQMSIIWNKRRYISYATKLWVNFVKDYLQDKKK
ncbi:LysR family transcriptional regulator [Dendrosporobacter sp. 1207_IL3150]|uniref:LysR family transcriptional regulator n=1 Tax=Dendrosporobacter sp. 1207_IL3150 TaxID=3084054 RepID=UPI002FDAEDBD